MRARKLQILSIFVVCALLYLLFMECPISTVSNKKPQLKSDVALSGTNGPISSSTVSVVAELEILNSTSKSKRFHGRVLELYNKNCSAQFFMVWLSPAKSFGPREMLAVDTLFTTNPGACLAILSNSLDSPKGYTVLKPFLDRGLNLVAVTPDIPFLVKNTPEYNLTIFPPDAFYPVNWLEIPRLFKKPATTREAEWVEKTVQDMSKGSYMIHLWNKVTRKIKIEEGSVMHRLISTHCTVCANITNSHT